MQGAVIIFSLILSVFGFAGGGGSSSGGGGYSGGSSYSSSSYYSSSSSSDDDTFNLGSFLVGAGFITVVVIISLLTSKKSASPNHNSTAQEKHVHKRAQEIFLQYQQDWSDFNLPSIKTYATDHYYQHATLMLEALRNMHRQNLVTNVKVSSTRLAQGINDATTFPLNCNVTLNFSGIDDVIDTKTDTKLYHVYAHAVSETWNFIYDGKDLKLSGISQPTESAPHLVKSLADFAKKHQLFYSPDWGRYALPNRGLIFDDESLKTSDVNNHIIGKWKDVLVQLYTYAKIPGTPSSYFLVGQLNVPKDYLGVIVKSRKYKHLKPKGYDKFELEWNDFNKRYTIFASKYDAISAFELLNPKFMEILYAKRLNYNLEVVDNVIYIFATTPSASESDYQELLDVLIEAYKELKL